MNSPVSSRNAITTPRSPGCFGSRIASLLVPISTTPPATTGFPYDCEPSSATHFTFFPVLTSHEVGNPVMVETMFRLGVPPHIGQSADTADEAARTTTALKMIRRMNYFLMMMARWPVGLLACWPTDSYRPSNYRN